VRFQFVQEQAGRARLLIVPATGPPKYNLDRIRRHLAQKLRGQIEIELDIRKEIPAAKSGKKPLVIQRTSGIEALLGQYEREDVLAAGLRQVPGQSSVSGAPRSDGEDEHGS
jgi:hypothetical protein